MYFIIFHSLVFAGLFGKCVVAIVAFVEMPFDALLVVMVPGDRRRGHRAPRPVTGPVRVADVHRGRRCRLVWRYGVRPRDRAPAWHHHAPQVDGGRVAVAQVVVVVPGVRVRGSGGRGGGGGPQIMMVVVSHFDGFGR